MSIIRLIVYAGGVAGACGPERCLIWAGGSRWPVPTATLRDTQAARRKQRARGAVRSDRKRNLAFALTPCYQPMLFRRMSEVARKLASPQQFALGRDVRIAARLAVVGSNRAAGPCAKFAQAGEFVPKVMSRSAASKVKRLPTASATAFSATICAAVSISQASRAPSMAWPSASGDLSRARAAAGKDRLSAGSPCGEAKNRHRQHIRPGTGRS